jgi:hypothetical protein
MTLRLFVFGSLQFDVKDRVRLIALSGPLATKCPSRTAGWTL